MTVAKIVTASVLCSLSGIALWNGIRSLPEADDRSTAPDDAQDDQPTEPAAKGTIAKPEKLAAPATKAIAKSQQPKVRLTTPISTNTVSTERLPDLPVSPISAPETILTTSRATDADEPAPAVGRSLRDIEGHWAQYYIESLNTKRIIQGFPDGSFRPDQSITSTEFNTMTQKAFGGRSIASFHQLRSTMPGQTVTRAEAAAFIYRELAKTDPAPIVTSVRVGGAVARPGAYSLAAMSNENLKQEDKLPTVGRAIQQAGGSLSTANLEQVEIRRITDTGATKVIKVGVGRSLQPGEISPDAVLQQNDEVIIPAIAPTAQQNPEPQAVDSSGDIPNTTSQLVTR